MAELVGREAELHSIELLLDGTAHQGGVLVIRGDAGIGKSALLDSARVMADGLGIRVVAATGVQSETNLSYAGLHQLLQPLLHGVPRLSARQRDALLTAFGMMENEVTDRFLIALAALELLADAAHEQPQLILVDDAQWLDAATLEALGFVARRIASEPITMLVAIRAGHSTVLTAARHPQLELAPLDVASCAALLDRLSPALPSRARGRILAAAAGNPLALVELEAGLRWPAANDEFAEQLPLTERLQHAFAARFADLPGATKVLVLVAAANDDPSLAETLLAGSVLLDAASTDSFEPAVAAGLVRMDLKRVQFRHPLVRSAVYQTATLTERRQIHGAIATALDAQPDRRAWHLAASAIAPDEAVAEALAQAAQRAEAKGGLTVAIDALARSAELCADADRRARRLLHAADLALEIGAPGRVQGLLAGVDAAQLDRPERSQLELLRKSTEALVPGDPASVLWLVSAAEQLADDGHVDLALRFLQLASTQANLADPGKSARATVSAAALRIPVRPDDARLLAILAFAEPEEYGALIIERAAAVSAGDLDPESAALVGASLNVVGAFDLSASFLAAAVAGLREQGRLGRLPLVLTHQAWTAINMMDWGVAVPSADEAKRLADDVGQPLWGVGAQTAVAMLAGLRGDYESADVHSREAETIALPTRASAMLAGIRLTRGVAALATGRYALAYEELRRMLDPRDPSYHYFQSLWGVGDFAEAALHSGNLGPGRAVMAELEALAPRVRSPWLQVGLLYGRPLLAPDDDVERLFQDGLDGDLSRWPVYRARMLLQYGIWLRRQRRVADSRSPLRTARDVFESLGVAGWAARARQELRASGEASSERLPEAWQILTSQELQIAKMASEGMSNREIGQRLFLSHRTVGSHLYRLFPKLGVTSRAQLSTVIGTSSAPWPEWTR